MPAAQHVVPAAERGKVVALSRVYVAVFGAVIVACVGSGSLLPALLIVGPRFYGGFVAQFFNITQHAGLAEDGHDHRLNTRTFLAGPVLRWLYCNMNYHVEHHMFPMVPYHALARLHETIKADTPPAYRSTLQAYAEIIPALARQARDPSYHVVRPLPAAQ